MDKSLNKGAIDIEAVLLLFVISFIIFGFIIPGTYPPPITGSNSSGTAKVTVSGGNSTGSSAGGGSVSSAGGYSPSPSSYRNSVSLGSGNASYTNQSYEEYVTISNRGDSPVDITGWQLKNAMEERTYDIGGAFRRFVSNPVQIPRASLFVSPTGNNLYQNVVLQPGERAIVTTGSVGARTPYKITSFKENMCTGYLENMPEYAFEPSLRRDCPRPSNEPGLENLPNQCRRFIESLSPCETPVIGGKDRNGDPCPHCVNGEVLPSGCRDFIEERFSYRGCLAFHGNDPEFSGQTWRIFLDRGWELWGEEYETISLFDRFGKLVDSISY